MIACLMGGALIYWDEFEIGRRIQTTNNAYVRFGTITKENFLGILPFIQMLRFWPSAMAGALFAAVARWNRDTYGLALREKFGAGDARLDSLIAQTGKTLAQVDARVTTDATVLAIRDNFQLCFWFSVACLLVISLMRPIPPSPLSMVRNDAG